MMPKRFATALLILALAGCGNAEGSIKGSGKTITDKRALQGDFQKIAITAPADIVVEVGKSPATVELTGDDNIVPLFTTKVEKGSLVIDTDKPFNLHNQMKIAIVAPVVKAINMSGAGSLDLQNMVGDSLDLSLTGACNTRGTGKLSKLSVDMTGAGKMDLGSLECKDVKLNVSGAGNGVINATSSLDVDVSGAATIKYKGHPAHVTKNISGAARLDELSAQ